MVPIVVGARWKDYFQIAPPHSYINVDDFHSIRQLTDYLTYLDKNDTAYETYFTWKRYGRIVVSPIFLHICGNLWAFIVFKPGRFF